MDEHVGVVSIHVSVCHSVTSFLEKSRIDWCPEAVSRRLSVSGSGSEMSNSEELDAA